MPINLTCPLYGSKEVDSTMGPYVQSPEKQTSRHTLLQSTSDMQITQPSPKPIVYPFALVKPCGIKGDATLKDINQRINMASPSQSSFKQSNTPSPSATSPFSGKPVLAVTKIHTEGKGTITIMRTRS
eukprot:c24990_g1_i2 orf=554-937(+)